MSIICILVIWLVNVFQRCRNRFELILHTAIHASDSAPQKLWTYCRHIECFLIGWKWSVHSKSPLNIEANYALEIRTYDKCTTIEIFFNSAAWTKKLQCFFSVGNLPIQNQRLPISHSGILTHTQQSDWLSPTALNNTITTTCRPLVEERSFELASFGTFQTVRTHLVDNATEPKKDLFFHVTFTVNFHLLGLLSQTQIIRLLCRRSCTTFCYQGT